MVAGHEGVGSPLVAFTRRTVPIGRRLVRVWDAGGAVRAAVVVLVLVLSSSHAEAAPSEADRALATELFNEGRQLMAAGKAAEACPKLAESHRLDPGGGTVLNLALCYEAAGKLASAHSALNEALALARRDEREDRVVIATERLAVVEPQLSRLVIEVPPNSDVTGLEVRRDGADVARAAWGSALPIDGGEHQIVVRAPGRLEWTTTIKVLAANDKRTLVVPRLEPELAPPPAPTSGSATAPSPPKPVVEATAPARSGGGQRTLGFIVGGVGVVGLGTGTYFGQRALSKRDESAALCKPTCSVRGAQLSNEATANADLSTVSFSVGIAALGIGTYLVLSAGDAERAKVGVVVGPGSAAVRGNF